MTRRLHTLMVAAVLIVPRAASAQVAGCPPGPNNVRETVVASVSFEPTRAIYTYSYTVTNAPDSPQEIDEFEVFAADPLNIQAPAGWHGASSFDLQSIAAQWLAVAYDNALEGGSPAALPPSPANVKAGGSLSGFRLESVNPPGSVQYRVYGYAPVDFALIPPGTYSSYESAMTDFAARCPDEPKTGSTTGPIEPMRVRIEVNPPKGGIIFANVFGSSTFDVRLVNQQTLRLGPGRSAPSKPVTRFRDVDGDKVDDLTVEFSESATAIGCGDSSVVMTGQTSGNVPFKGVATRVPTC